MKLDVKRSMMGRTSAARRKSETDLLLEAGEEPRLVQGVARGLSVLRTFRPGESSLSNAEIAARTGLAKPTVSRLTHTLTSLGYLCYMPRLGRYSLGPGVVALCHALLAGMANRIAARPILQKLADFSLLPVSLGMRDQLDMLYIETARHAASPPARFDLGARIPIEATAMGRAYLFGLPESDRKALLEAIRLRVGKSRWRTRRVAFDRAFESLGKRGFCLSLGEWRTDVLGAGAPVVMPDGTVLAINCGGPPFQVNADRLENEIGPRLAYAALQIATGGPA
jgi:DNA-binding IclR family transcriptional regulator